LEFFKNFFSKLLGPDPTQKCGLGQKRPSIGGEERCLWGLEGLKTLWGKNEGRKMLARTGNG